MKFKWIDKKINYDGTQLRSLFGYLDNGVLGDSIIAFEGACDVSFEHMVDGEDFLAGAKICGSHMLHFIIEEFGATLELAVTRQRLFAAMAFEILSRLVAEKALGGKSGGAKSSGEASTIYSSALLLRRDGDDIFWNDGKLSISIATVSPVSALIHFAVNVSNEGTPVKTSSLEDLEISPHEFAENLAHAFVHEVATIKEACCKVHWVK